MMKASGFVVRSVVASLALGVSVGACGGDDAESSGGDTGETVAGVESCGDVTEGICLDAGDIYFEPVDVEAGAGEVPITLVNIGQTQHTLVFDAPGPGDFKLEVSSNGDVDAGSVELEPGEYVFSCNIPGHRQAGMEGTLTIT